MSKEKPHFNSYEEVPYFRKQWFFWVMWFVFSPIAIGLLLTGEVYYSKKEELKTFGIANKIVAGIFGLLWIARVIGWLSGK